MYNLSSHFTRNLILINSMKNWLILIVIVLLSFGCSKDKVKPSEDSLIATQAIENINIVKDAYLQKDKTTLQTHAASNASEDIINNMYFEKAEMEFNPRFINITESAVKVNLNWQGAWWIAAERKLDSRGAVNFFLDKDTLKLIKIDGDSPFQIPQRGAGKNP